MAYQEKHVGLRIALATALGLTGASGVVLTGKAILEQASRQPVGAATQYPEGTVMPSQKAFGELVTPTPVNTPRPTETATSRPSNTPTLEATATNSPTNSPTTTPTKSPTPTETAMPVEKSPLPFYSAFRGSIINEQSGAKGMITLASIPKKDGSDQIAIFWMGRDANEAYPLELETVQGDTIKATSADNRPKWKRGTFTAEVNWDPSTQTLRGVLTTRTNPGGQLKIETQRFEANFVGTGKDAVLKAAKMTKVTATGLRNYEDLNRVSIDEFEREITLP